MRLLGGSPAPGVSQALLFALLAHSDADAQDLVTALLLSEAIYKASEGPPAAAAAALAALAADFPPGLAPLAAVQFSRRAAGHRFLLARSAGALFVAFQGTKRPADVLADAAFLKRQLWDSDAAAQPASTAPAAVAAVAAEAAAAEAEAAPAAHRGFLGRAQAVPAEAVYAHARRQGLRLVLCGHSLGGAVAQLSALRLLRAGADALRCIAFGAPAVGDAALAALVRRQGWERHFTSVALPEDPIPRLLLLQAPAAAAAATEPGTAAAEGAAAPSPPLEAAPSQEEAAAELAPGDGEGTEEQAEAADAGPTPSPSSGWLSTSMAWRAAGAARAAAAGLAQRPLTAAAGAASAARAGAALLALPPLLPAYSHFGRQLLLLPHALVDTTASGQPLPAAAAQSRLPLHSMAHYRGRTAALCWRALGRQQHEALDGGDADGDTDAVVAPVPLSHSLAPAVAVQQAVARLPVLPPPTPAQPGRQQPQQQPATMRVAVAVRGSGLECCTGAVLRLPGAASTALPALSIVNAARQQLLLDLPAAAAAADSHHGSGHPGWLHAAAESVAAVAKRAVGRHEQQHQQHQQLLLQRPGLVLHFAVPAAALRQLEPEQREHGWELRAASLVLLSDFGRHRAPVQLRPAVVWTLGLQPALAASTRRQLQAAWAPAPAAAAEQQQWWRRRPSLPGRIAAPLQAWRSGGVSGSSPPAEPAAAQAQHPDEALEQQQEQQQPRLSHLKQQAAARLASLQQRLGAALHAGDEQVLPHATLLGSLVLADATPALAGSPAEGHPGGSKDVAAQLELAAEALRWAASQRQQERQRQRRQGPAAAALPGVHQAEAGEEAGEEAGLSEPEPEDEDLAELSSLGLAAQLRREVARAGAAARRRARLLRHTRCHAAALRALPPPDALLLVLHRDQLLASAYGEGLDGGVLAAARQLAAACQACSPAVPVLLALASPTPLSAPFRRQVALACGLSPNDAAGGSSRRGSVVPLLLGQPRSAAQLGGWQAAVAAVPPADSVPQVGALQAALQGYCGAAVTGWEQRQLAAQPRL